MKHIPYYYLHRFNAIVKRNKLLTFLLSSLNAFAVETTDDQFIFRFALFIFNNCSLSVLFDADFVKVILIKS